MLNLIMKRYWNICLLRESPENTPYSIIWMVFSGIFLIILRMIEWNFSSTFISSGNIVNNDFTSIYLVISYVIYTYFILYFRGLSSRLVQTVTSLYCINIIIHIFVIPLLLLAPYLSLIYLTNPLLLFVGVFYLFLSLGLSVWQFVITSHIYRLALNVSGIQSVLAAFGLIAVNVLTLSLLQ